MKKTIKIIVNKKQITLTDREYKAAGGEGTVFVKDDTAYKVYHDAKKMIPVGKIQELSMISHSEVLAPTDVIYDMSNQPVGFTMKYVDGVEFLCKLFTKSFRDDNNLASQSVVDLVVKMQQVLQHIHNKQILVVDYNEMNFLLSNGFDTVFHIDVDSWQTKHFPATAIMESVRDRKSMNKFTELTDWFSWAIVTFQMYIGIHPYKGMHPDFRPSEFIKRMEAGVSVFDKKVKLPSFCQDFSVIPKRHLEWYKTIFVKNDRSVPPYPDQLAIAGTVMRTIVSKGNFDIKLLAEYIKPIKKVYYLNGERYVITDDGIFQHTNLILDFKSSASKVHFEMCDVFGEKPLIVFLNKDGANFHDLSKQHVSKIEAEKIMFFNQYVYTINNGQMVENRFERLGKIIHRSDVVCNITNSYKVFSGVIVQDDFMTCHLAIPYAVNKCINIHVKELDGYRIVDAKYLGGICMVVVERASQYKRIILIFDKSHLTYKIIEDDLNNIYAINFAVLQNGLCLLRDDEKLILFKDIQQRKEITDNVPFTVDMKLYIENIQVMFADENKLYSVTMK